MVDLKGQYERIKSEIDAAILEVIQSTVFINGPAVNRFQKNFETYLDVKHVIPCANGTDALQIAMMALELQPGDEVIIPSFTYIATAEVIALLKLKPVMVDVDENDFNIAIEQIEQAITQNTKAIVPVHLFGQAANMEAIMSIAQKYNLFVVEDNAQSIGAEFSFTDGTKKKLGCIGHIGCTSFFPSKNLGCYGDGGALMTNDEDLAKKIKMIANHGQSIKYIHDLIGCNSRLDSIQAAILDVKLQYLEEYIKARNIVAEAYDEAFRDIAELVIPKRVNYSNHVFHQYTLKVKGGKRDELKNHLQNNGVSSMIYYPIPLYKQKAFSNYISEGFTLPVTEQHCKEVLSLPIHTEMTQENIGKVIDVVKEFYKCGKH